MREALPAVIAGVVVGLVVVVPGLALALRYDLEWLRVASYFLGTGGSAAGAMIVKRRRQRQRAARDAAA